MSEYTYDDIVTAKDILTGKVKEEDIIGKKGWFLDVMPSDMSLNHIMRIAGSPHILKRIKCETAYPFVADLATNDGVYSYFLPEKEPAPEWRPLDLSRPEDRELLRGKWIRSKVNDHESVVTAFKYQECEWKAHLPQMGLKSGKTLLDDYVFIDGSPIGRKVEERPF